MVYEQRIHRDYVFGSLALAASVSDTTISSAAFASLGTGYTTTTYQPLVLHNPTSGLKEVVWITGHAAGSQTVTVVRGREGTTALAWPENTQVIDSVTVRDLIRDYTRASLPADPFVGQRALVLDENVVVERTLGGWAPSTGVAIPSEFGRRTDGTAIPTWASIQARGSSGASGYSGTTDASGQITVTYTAPFLNQTLAAVATWVSGTPGGSNIGIYPGSFTASGFKVYVFNSGSGATLGAGAAVTFTYVAFGY